MSVPESLGAALAGRYTIEYELGHGGMATVFMARDVRHARPVAVKVMARELAAADGAARFLREVRFAARLTHPHILGVHDSGEAAGLLYYVMPYVEGETLRTRIAREGALPMADAVRYLRELADALAYAHGQGVVHRDLKPENVLVSGGHAVIADFGIAKAVAVATGAPGADAGRLTGTGISLGTPAYMAPEQAVGDRAADHRADLYALGVVAWEMLVGSHPFGVGTAQAFVAAHLTETPAPIRARRPDVPPALATLVARLLAKDPAERPASASDVVRELDALTSVGNAHPIRRRWATLGLAAGLLAMVVAAWLAIGRRTRDAGLAAPRIGKVAVLPLENTSGNPEDDPFSEGLTGELANRLAQVPGLRVAGKQSARSFKGKQATVQELGRALDVDAIVSGSVRRAGQRLRVGLQLVGTHDGKVLWDAVYESESGDIFGVQAQFTKAVMGALAPFLGTQDADTVPPPPDLGRGTKDPEAYQLYLQGQYYWQDRTPASIVRAIGYFKEAIARDPKFARAHAGLALTYLVAPVFTPDPADSMAALGLVSARRAMALDSGLADAQIAVALTGDNRLEDIPETIAHYRRAIEIEPWNAFAHHSYGFFILSLGRTDEAVRELEAGVRLDPSVKSAGASLGLALTFARRYQDALAANRRVLALDSGYALAHVGMAMAQAMAGQPDSALRSMASAQQSAPELPALVGTRLFVLAAAGRWDDIRRERASLHRATGNIAAEMDAAYADFLLGDREAMVRWMSSAQGRWRWYLRYSLGCSPMLDPLWSDARFVAAMKAVPVQPCKLARPWPFRSPPRGAASD